MDWKAFVFVVGFWLVLCAGLHMVEKKVTSKKEREKETMTTEEIVILIKKLIEFHKDYVRLTKHDEKLRHIGGQTALEQLLSIVEWRLKI